jgi:subtilase family serine protease
LQHGIPRSTSKLALIFHSCIAGTCVFTRLAPSDLAGIGFKRLFHDVLRRKCRMSLFTRNYKAGAWSTGILALGLIAIGALPQAASAAVAPALQKHGINLGPESSSTPLSGTVWLNLHNRAQLDAIVKAMYTVGSPTYHKWLTVDELKQYAPTAAEVESVKKELAAHNLTVVSGDKMNFSVKIKGQSGDFERAFQTQIGRYQYKGNLVHTTSTAPRLTGQAGSLVNTVTGFNNSLMKSASRRQINPRTGLPTAAVPVKAAKASGEYTTSACFYAPSSVTLSVTGDTAGTGTFSGLTYGANASGTGPGVNGCGYGPSDLAKFYDLTPAFSAGISGQGQTVVIVDAYGSPTITADAATFNSIFNLPKFTTSNFAIYEPSPFTATDAGWATETTLDVESAHSVAPGASIALVATASNYNDDLQEGILYALTNSLGNVISNSYSEAESEDDPTDLAVWNQLCELGATLGVSVDFATGDDGDLALDFGYTDVPVPADGPYATAVGGTSVTVSPVDGSIITTGWGSNVTFLTNPDGSLAFPPEPIDEPASPSAFYGGAGGGISAYYAKPFYQSALAGPGRHIPDVSAIADPFTGLTLVFTISGEQYLVVYGGTSLATPVFSGIWALANQYAGTPLGQAAPYVAAASAAGLIKDVVPVAGPENVTGSITLTASPEYGPGTYDFTAQDLAEPFYGTIPYVSTLWDDGGGNYLVLTFGTDSSLFTAPGWDDVTGYGTPDLSLLFK